MVCFVALPLFYIFVLHFMCFYPVLTEILQVATVADCAMLAPLCGHLQAKWKR